MSPAVFPQVQQARPNSQMTCLPSDYYSGFMGGQDPGEQTRFMNEIMARGNAAKTQEPISHLELASTLTPLRSSRTNPIAQPSRLVISVPND